MGHTRTHGLCTLYSLLVCVLFKKCPKSSGSTLYSLEIIIRYAIICLALRTDNGILLASKQTDSVNVLYVLKVCSLNRYYSQS